jgi:hypothetical protein
MIPRRKSVMATLWDPAPPWAWRESDELPDLDEQPIACIQPRRKIPEIWEGGRVKETYPEYWAAMDLGKRMLARHGLTDWKVEVRDIPERFLGRCDFNYRRIVLHAQLLDGGRYEIRQTLLHEIAHALSPPNAGHGPEWQQKAQELGVTQMDIRRNLAFARRKWADLGVWPWQGVLALSTRGEPPAGMTGPRAAWCRAGGKLLRPLRMSFALSSH